MRRRFTFVLVVLAGLAAAATAAARAPRVLRVGSFHGKRGRFRTLQAAVDAARPGDWILVGPGDYKTYFDRTPAGAPDVPAAVLVTKPRIHIRGMNRNTVVIDGTRLHTPRCSSRRPDQNFGPIASGSNLGVNGIMVYKADDVWVQNLTVCNFLDGSGDTGNGVWWNGGDGSYKIGGWGFLGSYLNATSTFFDSSAEGEKTAAEYGIFSSNWSGGTFANSYSSNFNDSAFYIGACQRVCDQVVDHVQGEYSALGYSGSNSGGSLIVKNSEFAYNQDGFDTNSQNGDNPPPQDGACPGNAISPITHTHSCWVFMDNRVHDNNNPNVPAAGEPSNGPVGTGLSLSGARDDTVMHNTFTNNGAWGVLVVPYPDSGPPCSGGTPNGIGPGSCLFDEWGDAVLDNTFVRDGFFGHPSNGDIAWFNFQSGHPTDCFAGNTEPGGKPPTTSPAGLEQSYPKCDGHPVSANGNTTLLTEALCDTQIQLVSGVPEPCPSGAYPRRTHVVMHPLPGGLKSMPNPCAGVPANPWCSRRRGLAKRRGRWRSTAPAY